MMMAKRLPRFCVLPHVLPIPHLSLPFKSSGLHQVAPPHSPSDFGKIGQKSIIIVICCWSRAGLATIHPIPHLFPIPHVSHSPSLLCVRKDIGQGTCHICCLHICSRRPNKKRNGIDLDFSI